MSLENATPAGRPDVESALVAVLEAPMPEERRDVRRSEAGILLDRLLATRARRKAAYEVAIGECLAAMSVGTRTLTFGHVSIGDYARERLGLNARTAQKQAKLAADEFSDLNVIKPIGARCDLQTKRHEALFTWRGVIRHFEGFGGIGTR